MEWFDLHIQRALSHLEAQGKLGNTLIIATSDHGMPFPRVKGQIYDDGFHVPFAVRWGDQIKPGRTVTDFITFPDLAPTLLEIADVPRPQQMTGKSFLQQLLSEQSGRIDRTRDHTLLGKERHDIGRTDGELFSVGYPVRAIRTDRFLYVKNFLPHRWPVGDPKYGLRNCDTSPTKRYLANLKSDSTDYEWYELSFGKRPAEELYDIQTDPDCITNLATKADYEKTKQQLWTQLENELRAQNDPRILGQGEIFDYYPNCRIKQQQEAYDDPSYDPVAIFKGRFEKVKERAK